MELNVIPRLAKGSWSDPNAGFGCIMNLMHWEQLTEEDLSDRRLRIIDKPSGFRDVFACILIRLNDRLCQETTSHVIDDERAANLICPEHTMFLLDMAHALQGSDYLLDQLLVICNREEQQWLVRQAGDLQHTFYAAGHLSEQYLAYRLQRFVELYTKLLTKYDLKPELDMERVEKAIVNLNTVQEKEELDHELQQAISNIVATGTFTWTYTKSDYPKKTLKPGEKAMYTIKQGQLVSVST